MKEKFEGKGFFIAKTGDKVSQVISGLGYTVVSQDSKTLSPYLSVDISEVIESDLTLDNVFRCRDHSGNPHFVGPLSTYGDFSEYNVHDYEDACEVASTALYDGDLKVILTKKFIEYLRHKGFDSIEVAVRPLEIEALEIETVEPDFIVLNPSKLSV